MTLGPLGAWCHRKGASAEQDTVSACVFPTFLLEPEQDCVTAAMLPDPGSLA